MKVVSLASVADVIRGVSFSKEEGDSVPSEDRLPIIRAGSIQDTLLLGKGQIWVPKDKIKKNQKILRNDIIMCTSSGSTDLVGKCAKSDVNFEGSFGAFCAGIRSNPEKVSASYLYHFLSSPKFRNWTKSSSGANIKNIRISELADFEIPLPPLKEQKRIAAILDKADAIRRKRQQAIKLADEFLRAVFLDMFGDPVMNPKGWEVKLLKEISLIQIGPFGTQLHQEDYISGGIPLINPSHIVDSKISPNLDLTVGHDKYNELPEYQLKRDDIIMGRRGEMGRAAMVSDKEIGWLCGTGSLFIRPEQKGAFAFYLHKFLTSDYMKKYLESESLGATMPNLNKTIVGNIRVPIPDHGTIIKFQNVLGINEQLQCRMSNTNSQLFVSLSQKVFSGNL